MNPNSIKAKLKNYSKANKKVHQKTLTTFFQERFLYRLSVSEYKELFLLKGGALAYTISREDSRHTKDIDFLFTQLKYEQDTLVTLFKEMCILEGKDGVTFNPNSIKIRIKGLYLPLKLFFARKTYLLKKFVFLAQSTHLSIPKPWTSN